MTQIDHANAFQSLHVKGSPVVIYNIWDPGSAKAVAKAGASAIGTGSAPVAMAHGYPDGEKMPLDLVLSNAERIVQSVEVPVTLDFEGAYAVDAEGTKANVARALETGIIGFNFEDQIVGGEGLYDIAAQAKRVSAMRQACDTAGIPAFINARTDIYLKAMARGDASTPAMLEEAIERANAYAEAGASGFFAPGLMDLDMIQELCAAVPLPVNIIALPGAPDNGALAEAGVARISYGPVPYRQMTAWLTGQAEQTFASLGGEPV